MLFSTMLVISLLLLILGFVFAKGISKIDIHFLTGDFDAKTVYVDLENVDGLKITRITSYNVCYTKLLRTATTTKCI